MLVDTGASATVIKKEILEKLSPSSQSKLIHVNLNLITATGEASSFLGKLCVDIQLGKHMFTHEILVAYIQNDRILGVDFLTPYKCHVLLSKSCLSVNNDKIPCYHFNKSIEPTICRIAVAQDVVIPPDSEVIVRFCVDYRKLNDVTIKDSHPLPRIDDTLDALSGATKLSVLDLRSGYWNVNISEEDKEKTAFSIPGSGLWQFNKMSFGLCNAPATFVR